MRGLCELIGCKPMSNSTQRSKIGALAIVAGVAALLCAAPTVAAAQSSSQAWPQRSVKFLLPFGAGSATDAGARMMAEKLAGRWGKPVVVENKPGADGLLAINAFVAANDDHVLLYASSASFNTHPYMHEKLSYDLERDLLPIARVTDTVGTASVPEALGPKTVAELVALAKAKPNSLNAAGAAGVPEFTLGYFLKTQSLAVTKVPYRDIVPAASDLAAGQIQFLVSSAAIVRALSQAGKLRVLAVTGRQRAAIFPDVPTTHEAGYPTLGFETTAGLYGPKGMARDLRDRLAKDVIAVVSEPEITQKLIDT